jgi:galactose mutarotase-like enzyme
LITTISNSKLIAKINSKGAELISLQNQNNKEFIWDGNPEYWGKHSPVLFPIVGTLKNNNYTFDKKTYHLSRHGFARDSDFEIVIRTESQVVFSLQSDSTTKSVYPFNFELQVSYSLLENELFIGYKIINNDKIEIPFSIGGHPAFALTEKFEDYSLAFEQAENLVSYQLENDLLSDKTFVIPIEKNKLPLTYSLFEKDALIFKKLNSKQISILENNRPILHFKFDDFPNFGIWTKNNASFICLEPWLGYSDTFNCSGNITEKEGIQFLSSKKTFDCQFSIEIV